LSFWKLQAVGWCGLFALAVLASLPDLRARGVWPGITVFAVTLLAVSLILRPIYRAWWTRGRSWLATVVVATVASLCGALAAASGPFRWFVAQPPVDWTGWPFDVAQCFVVLLLWSTLYFSVKRFLDGEAEGAQTIVAESEARRARLIALRAQLNPHFLFNALNGVSTLILERENARANAMLTQLSMLLRASLEDDGTVEVSLRDEMALVERYLDVERARLGDRLRFDANVSESVWTALVPTMLLQPLIENAVRHGVATSTAPARIRLVASRDHEHLHISSFWTCRCRRSTASR
jgi:hypothetical protein